MTWRGFIVQGVLSAFRVSELRISERWMRFVGWTGPVFSGSRHPLRMWTGRVVTLEAL